MRVEKWQRMVYREELLYLLLEFWFCHPVESVASLDPEDVASFFAKV